MDRSHLIFFFFSKFPQCIELRHEIAFGGRFNIKGRRLMSGRYKKTYERKFEFEQRLQLIGLVG
jgi:hypothetical protein